MSRAFLFLCCSAQGSLRAAHADVYLPSCALISRSYQPPLVPENPAEDELSLTNEILPASGLSALPPTLVNPQEEILEEECDLAPI